jgi:hypothetical protein
VQKHIQEKLVMTRLSNWLQNVSKGWVALITLVIFILFTALVLPRQTSTAESNTGDDWTPDLSFYYTGDDLHQLAKAYGEDGRAAYIHARFTFDLIWPLVYMVFLTTGISWLFRKGFAPGSVWHLSNLVPLFGMMFDYLENIATSLVMARYPTPTSVIAAFAPIFTMVKWIFVSGSFMLFLVGIVVGVWKMIRKRGR